MKMVLQQVTRRLAPTLLAVVAALTCAVLPGRAQAQTISSFSESRSSFTQVGQTINYTLHFNSGGYAVSSVDVTSSIGIHYSCSGWSGVATNQNVTCTGSYTVQTSDLGGIGISEITSIFFDNQDSVPVEVLNSGSGTENFATVANDFVPATTTTSISFNPNPAGSGVAVTITGTVSGGSSPTGSIDFYDDTTNTDLGSANLSGTSAHISVSNLSPGAHLIEADYSGDAANSLSYSNEATLTIGGSTAQTITFPQPADTAFTSAPPTLGATASSGLAVAYTSSTTGVCTVTSGGAITFHALGQCTINANQAGGNGYSAATQVSKSFNVTTGVNVISFPALSDTAFTSAPPTPAATATSGVAPTYSSNTTAICTVTSGGTITFLALGQCTIQASQGATGNYGAATAKTQSFNVTGAANTINFPALPDTGFAATPPTVAATATSGVAPTYASLTAATCSVTSGGAITFVAVGQCTIQASQGAVGNYAAAASQSRSFNITGAPNSISFPALADTAFTASPPSPAATASSGVAPTYASLTAATCSVTSGGAITFVAIGQCAIQASEGAVGNYAAAASQSRSFNITGGLNLISFPALADTAFTAAPPTPAATASSGVAPTYASTTPANCSVTSGGAISFVAIGQCTVQASQGAVGNYAAASSQSQSFNITGGLNVISFPALANTAFTSAPPVPAATASSGVAPTYSSQTPATCGVTSGGAISFVSIGLCTVQASQEPTGNYAAAAAQTQSFTIGAGANAISFPALANTAFTSAPPTPAATATSGVAPTYVSLTPASCGVTAGGAINFLLLGQCTIEALQGATGNYAAASSQSQSFTITAGVNLISFPVLANTAYTSAPPTPAATATSGVSPAYASATLAVCNVAPGGAITFVSTGLCTVQAFQLPVGNYGAASTQSQSFTVLPGLNTISFPAMANTPLTSPAPAPAATATSGVAPTYASNSPTICQVTSGGVVTLLNAGPCVLQASQGAVGDYGAATPRTSGFTVLPGANLIGFPQPANTPFTSAPPSLAASASSGLAVSYASNAPAVCAVTSGGVVSFVAGGVCSITASQGGNANYSVAAPVTDTFTVTPGRNVISFPQPLGAVFTGAPPSLAATASSGLAVSYASTTAGVCSVTAGGTISFVAVGDCSITASQGGNVSYAPAAPVSQQFAISAGANVITFAQPANTALTGSAPTLSASASSGLAVSFAANSAAVCSVTPAGVVTLIASGGCSITASQAGNAVYAAATPVTHSFQVAPGANVISFPQPAATAFTSAPPTLAASATSGLAVTYASTALGVCTVTPGGALTFVGAGTCALTASQGGSARFAPAAPVSQSFSVTGGVNAISFPQPADTAFTSPPPKLGASASSGLAVAYASNAAAVCAVSPGGALSFVSAGQCSLTASQAGDGKYAGATPVTQTFNVLAGANAISFPAPPNTAFTSPPPTLAASASSGAPVTYASNAKGVCNVTSGGTLSFLAGGQCSITASQAAGGNFAAATPVTQAFTVTPGVNSISFPAPPNTPYASGPPTLTASASSGLAVSYASNAAAVCAVTPGGTISFVGGGLCSITASQGGNASFAAAAPVTDSFSITAATNTISFPALASVRLGGAPPSLAATASSGLAVTYGASTPSICSVTPAGAVTMFAVGSCSITASQAGDTAYAAASPVAQSFAITPAANVISFPAPANTALTSPVPSLAAVASSGLAVSYASNTSAVCAVSGSGALTLASAGLCSITASQAGNASFAAASPVSQTFNVTAGVNVISFPAPVSTALTAAPPALGATASSGLAVSYASNSAAVCAVTPAGALSLLASGSCSITASQGGNASFAAASPVTQSFAVTTGTNVISFPQPANTAFTSAPPALAATATSGLAVSYASNSAAVCTVTAGGAISFVAGGQCAITASQGGNASFAAAPPVTRSFSVTPGSNVINFPAPANTAFTAAPPTLAAAASSGLAVSYGSTTTQVCNVTPGGALSFVAGGLCSITASQVGNASFAAAAPVTESFTVTTGGNVISFPAPANTAFTSAPPTLAASASSGLPVAYASTTTAVCAVTSAGAVGFVAGGTCAITASQAGNAAFAAATPVSQSFTVLAGANAIAFPQPPATAVTATPPVLAAVASSGLPVTYASAASAVCTVTPGGTIAFVTAGSCAITASQGGNPTFAAASPVTDSFAVTAAGNAISFAPIAAVAYGAAPPALSASASSGLAVSFASTTAGVCAVTSSGTVTLVAAGACSITASQAGDARYAAAASVSQTFTVNAGANLITFAQPANTPFTAAPPALVASASSGLAVTFVSDAGAICTVTSAGAVSFVSAGACSITALQAGNAAFAGAASVTRTFSVTAGANVISFPQPASTPIASPPPALTASASSGLAVSYASNSPAVCTVTSAGAVSFVAAGVCQVTASQAGNVAYAAASPVTQSFSITLGANLISFPTPAAAAFGAAPPTLGATASSGLAVSYASNAPAVCTVTAGGTLSLVSAGTCSITVSQAGNAAYAAASPVTQSFNVAPGANVISFPAPAAAAFGAAPPTLGASASSGLAVSYASNSAAVCTVTSGGALSLIAAGTCSITATQAGNADYAAASPVTQGFAVTAGANTITFGALAGRPLGGGAFPLTASASSGLAVSFATTTPTVCGISGSTASLLAVGQCAITASQAGNANFAAATPVSRSFAISKAASNVTLTASGVSVFAGVPVILTATVTGLSPTGTVTFLDGTTVLGTATLSGGQASLTTRALVAGAHAVTASYSGDASNAAGVSGILSVTVNARPNPAQDPDVRAVTSAQVTAVQRFAQTQIENISQRLERMHDDQEGAGFSMGIGFTSPDGAPTMSLSDLDPARSNNPFSPMRALSDVDGGPAPMGGMAGGASNQLAASPGESGGPGVGAPPLGFHVWTAGAVSTGTQNQYGAIDNRFTTSGVTMGVDGKVADHLKVGAAIGFASEATTIGTDGSNSSATNFTGSLYADYRLAPQVFVDLIGGYGDGKIDSRRYSTAGAVFVQGDRDAHEWYGSLSVEKEQKTDGPLMVAPYLRLDAVQISLDPYSESGSPIWALSYERLSTQSVSAVAGVRGEYGMPMRWGVLTAIGRFEYQGRLEGTYNQQIGYADLAGGPLYTVTDQALSSTQFLAGLSLRATARQLAVELGYELSGSGDGNLVNTFRGEINLHF